MVGILGYGNLGKSLYRILCERGEDVFVFSNRREGREGDFFSANMLKKESLPLDTLFLAHGSSGSYRDELLVLAKKYNLISAYDIHSDLVPLRRELASITEQHHTVTILGTGWDPGLLSLARAICRTVFPEGIMKTQWGEGVSEGHSFALRQIDGVKDAIQYTVPTEHTHRRICYVVCDREEESRIQKEILEKREYFSQNNTEIHFITEDEFLSKHKGVSFHRGRVSAALEDKSARIDFSVEMQRNPDFTARIMIAYLDAIRRLVKEEKWGAYSPVDIPLSYLISDDLYSLW